MEKEQLQLKSLDNLKRIARCLGIKYTTSGKYGKHNKDLLEDDIIAKIQAGFIPSQEKDWNGEKDTNYYTLIELHKMAKDFGIKYFKQYNKKELCGMLGCVYKKKKDGAKPTKKDLPKDLPKDLTKANGDLTKANGETKAGKELTKSNGETKAGKTKATKANGETKAIEKDLPKAKYYNLIELKKMCRDAGIFYLNSCNRKQLCEMVGVEFITKKHNWVGHKHTLTNVETGVVEEFKSASAIAKKFEKFDINSTNIFYRVAKQIPLVVDGVSYIIKKIEDLPKANSKYYQLANLRKLAGGSRI